VTFPKHLPPVEYLRACLRYEPDTGKLFWRERPTSHFETEGMWNTWNKRFAGTEAFHAPQSTGHFNGTLDWVHYSAHRVIWKLVTGEEPPRIVDHEDRDPQNNRWVNLRAATKGQNNINSTKRAGVYFDKARNQWAAEIGTRPKKVFLGRFATREAAVAARSAGVKRLFGEFAP
jgi:HNH endonuclease/AP2 domain